MEGACQEDIGNVITTLFLVKGLSEWVKGFGEFGDSGGISINPSNAETVKLILFIVILLTTVLKNFTILADLANLTILAIFRQILQTLNRQTYPFQAHSIHLCVNELGNFGEIRQTLKTGQTSPLYWRICQICHWIWPFWGKLLSNLSKAWTLKLILITSVLTRLVVLANFAILVIFCQICWILVTTLVTKLGVSAENLPI